MEDSAIDRVTAVRLLERANEARGNAYAPYSGFRVGAAVLDTDGRIHTGVNVENASYGLSTCAERSAVARAIGEGARGLKAVAIAGPGDGIATMPCGSCRQILHEFGSDLTVVVAGAHGDPRRIPIGDLLPEAFDSRRLRDESEGS